MATITQRQGFVAAWQYRPYRFLWVSALGFNTGHWMATVVVSWLVLELTDSPFLVGLLGACRFVAMFLGPFCGTISDRYDRRHILLVVQVSQVFASLAMMALFIAGQLEVWHLFVFTLFGGLGFTLDFSTRYVAASDIVKSDHLVSAISLLMVATGVPTIVGPLLGGSLLGIIGTGGCFALMAGGFLVSCLALLPMKAAPFERAKSTDSMWQNVMAGIRYIRNDQALLALIALAALANLLILPYRYTILPLFARDIFNSGPSGFGLLLAMAGLGATLGSLGTGALPGSMNKGYLLIGVSILWPLVLGLFAASRLLLFSMLMLVVAGAAQGVLMALIQSLLLIWSSVEMRGRVSGARAFAISTLPLGNLVTGAGAGLWGAPLTLAIVSSGFLATTLLIAFWARGLYGRGKAAG